MENRIFICCMGILIMLALMCLALAILFKNTEEWLKDISNTQISILHLNEVRSAPRIITEKKNVECIHYDYVVPHWAEQETSEIEIKSALVDGMLKELIPYIEIESDRDIKTMETKYRARLKVVK